MSFSSLLFNLLAVFVTFQLVAAIPASSLPSLLNARAPAGPKHWHGWDKVDKMFVFGASYATTGFRSNTDQQPSPSHPLGNSLRGATSSHGPNFVSYLTTEFNRSSIYTYNHAAHGAEVDRTAVSGEAGGNDMVHQITTVFTPYYTANGGQNRRGDWSPESTLFISFFGINDILSSYEDQNSETMDHIFDSYSNNFGRLYDLGARNFLLLNVPPLDIAPRFNQDAAKAGLIAGSIADFNTRLSGLADSLNNAYPDVSVFQYDVHGAFLRIQADASGTMAGIGHPPLTNLRRWCPAYQQESMRANIEQRVWDESRSFQQSCGARVDQYFWLDGLHPTWPIHKRMAMEIANYLTFTTLFGPS
ncbi:MAG: hypothetical protein Q9214_004679 [Letrouitia sp. 1 TL-2023]